MRHLPTRALVVAAIAGLALSACTPGPGRPSSAVSPPPSSSSLSPAPSPPSSSPADATSGAAPTTPPPTPATPLPGEPCDPAGGLADCTDATGFDDGQFRYIEGYADCVAAYTSDESHGLCTDLDRDGYAGYPDSG